MCKIQDNFCEYSFICEPHSDFGFVNGATFTDDTRFVPEIHDNQGCLKMQLHLEKAYNSTIENNMSFNKVFRLVVRSSFVFENSNYD